MQQAGESMEAQNAASEIKVRAERRAGELLREMEKNKGTVLAGNNKPLAPEKDGKSSNPPKLKDLGIHPMQSSRWQQAAAVPEKKRQEAR